MKCGKCLFLNVEDEMVALNIFRLNEILMMVIVFFCGATSCPRLLLISYYGTTVSLSVSSFVC